MTALTRTPTWLAVAAAALVFAELAPGAPSQSPQQQPPADAPPPRLAGESEPPAPPGERGLFDPAAMKARMERRLEDLKREEGRLNEALDRINRGDSPADIARSMRPRYNRRNAENRPDAGGTPRPDRDSPGSVRFPQTAEERDKLIARFRENFPDLTVRLDRWIQADPDGAAQLMARMAPRLQEAVELRERDPEMFTLKAAEVEANFRTMVAVRATLEAKRRKDDPGGDARFEAAREELRLAMGQQFDARLEIQQREIDALSSRLESLRGDHAKKLADRDRSIADRLDKMLEIEASRQGRSGAPRNPESK